MRTAPVPARPLTLVQVDADELGQTDAVARERVTAESVASLAATIERFGLLHPLVVAPSGNKGKPWTLLAGRRRLAALKSLGRAKGIPARVLEVDGLSAGELVNLVEVVENEQREPLDAVRESEVVAELLGRPGATLEQVAATLGRPASWVQRRARLRELAPELRAARAEEPVSDWPVSWLELVALLPREEQAALVAGKRKDAWPAHGVRSERTLRLLVRDRLHALSAAPWPLEREGLARTQACSACPKRSGAQAGFFDDESPKLRLQRCLDHACWDRKLQVFTHEQAQAARAEHGRELVLLAGPEPQRAPFAKEGRHGWDAQDLASELARDPEVEERSSKFAEKVQPEHAWQPAKASDPEAVPTLVVSGVGAGTTAWRKPVKVKDAGNGKRATGERAAPAGKPAKKLSLDERMLQLQRRRQKAVVLEFVERFEGWSRKLPIDAPAKLADPEVLLELVSWYGCAAPVERPGVGCSFQRSKLGGDKRASVVARGALQDAAKALSIARYTREPEVEHRDLHNLATLLGMLKDFDDVSERVLREHPVPKAWGLETSAAAAPKGKAKGKSSPSSTAGEAKKQEAPKSRKPQGKDAASGEREEA